MVRTIFRCGLAMIASACTVNNDNNEPFGVGTYSTTHAPTVPPGDGAASSESTGEDGETDDAGSSDDADEDADAQTTGDADPTNASTDTGAGLPDATTDDGGVVPDGNQPGDGLWSQCTTAPECGPIPAMCIYLVDENMNPTDGFCSKTGCANPAVDCPSPGATATPTCVPVDVDGPQQACALSCAAGMCPVGMACVDITDFGKICI
jgi:hypothetical protein